MSFSLRTQAADLALSAAVSGLASYVLHQIEPVPDPTYLMTVVVINACFRSILDLLLYSTAHHFTKKYGYVEENQDAKITNHKFFYLAGVFRAVFSVLTPVFYRSIGKAMGYQTPSFVHTYGYLTLSMASIHFTKAMMNFISSSYYVKPVSAN